VRPLVSTPRATSGPARGATAPPGTAGKVRQGGRIWRKADKVLELLGLTRRYGDVVALDDLSFTVREGQMFGFVGPNGAGKTTAMRIVLGVLEPDRGEVRWRGRPVDAETRRRFGYMPEERGLYPKMRVRDQLEYLARLHGLSAREATDAAGYWIERLGVAERSGDRVEQLSLGNQQRVQLAAALVHDPEVLVLDEPFSGLDPVGVDVLAEVLAGRAADGIPVIFSSHQLELVERLCEAVAIINHGRLVAAGSVEELRRSGGERRYQVEVTEAPSDWTDSLEGVTVLEKTDGRVVLAVEGDEQRVLDAARAAGRVVSFGPVQPSLAQLFRQAVQA
jgi:ABC-2 type transport system ATP-binding protein